MILTQGAEGAVLASKSGVLRIRPPRVDVVSAVGAGDSFNAGFLHKYVHGADLADCVAYGNLAAACSTTRAGGTEAFRDREYWKKFFATHTARG